MAEDAGARDAAVLDLRDKLRLDPPSILEALTWNAFKWSALRG
jgi:hypothetical protein